MHARSSHSTPVSRAFKQAAYQVHSPDGIVELHIGKMSPSLRAHMQTQGVKHAAIITAYNPQARITDDSLNRHAHIALLQAVEALHLPWWPATNLDPTGAWPAEPSIFILGITVEQARWLARRFRQLAFVDIGPKAIPKLNFVQQHMPNFCQNTAVLPQNELDLALSTTIKH